MTLSSNPPYSQTFSSSTNASDSLHSPSPTLSSRSSASSPLEEQHALPHPTEAQTLGPVTMEPIPSVQVLYEDDPITPMTRYYWCQITGFIGQMHDTSCLGRVIYIEKRFSGEVNLQLYCVFALWKFYRSGCMPGILITDKGYNYVPNPPAFTSADIPCDLPRFKPSDLAEIHNIPSPDGGYHRNVKRVRLQSNTSETMILKTLSPSSEPNDLVFELKRLQQLHQCACTPNLLGIFGDPLGDAYRGLLIQDLGGKSVFELLCEYPRL
jgi:hypothetical protein